MSDNMKWIITGIIVVLISAAEVMWFWPWFVRWCLGNKQKKDAGHRRGDLHLRVEALFNKNRL